MSAWGSSFGQTASFKLLLVLAASPHVYLIQSSVLGGGIHWADAVISKLLLLD